MIRRVFDGHLLRFLLVGVVNTLVGAGTMFLLYNLFHCSYWLSSAANYVVGGACSFLLNKYYTFQKRIWSWRELIRFIVTMGICYLIGYGVAKPLVAYLLSGSPLTVQENIAMLAGMVLYTGCNYLGQRFFAFAAV